MHGKAAASHLSSTAGDRGEKKEPTPPLDASLHAINQSPAAYRYLLNRAAHHNSYMLLLRKCDKLDENVRPQASRKCLVFTTFRSRKGRLLPSPKPTVLSTPTTPASKPISCEHLHIEVDTVILQRSSHMQKPTNAAAGNMRRAREKRRYLEKQLRRYTMLDYELAPIYQTNYRGHGRTPISSTDSL